MDKIIELTECINFNDNTTTIYHLTNKNINEQRLDYLNIINIPIIDKISKNIFKNKIFRNKIFKNKVIDEFSIYCNKIKYTSDNGILLIGRGSSKCNVDIKCPLIYISRIHCILFKYNNIFHILDSWSLEGTYLSNTHIFNNIKSSTNYNRSILLSSTKNFNIRLSKFQYKNNILNFSENI
jgi:hypothetical protein